MNILIQKFGGTSVSTKERRQLVIDKIKRARDNGYSVVVVVSAMGRKGDPYATDSLLALLEDNFKKENKLASDLLMGCGEIISSVVMCNELNSHGIKSVPLTGGQAGIITDDNFGDASAVKVETDTILKLLNEGITPIVTGFQGRTSDGFLTTLGRGGSDVSASILGAELEASSIEIYTDVDGIMTADPKMVDNPSLIREIDYNEVFQFAEQGAKVIHPKAVKIAMKASIPLVIKNTLNDCEGTVISSYFDKNLNPVTGIASLNGRVQITIEFQDNERYFEILDILARNNISIDLINIFPQKHVFTVGKDDIEKLEKIFNDVKLNYSKIENCSKIALIGHGMHGTPGVMARIIRGLSKEKIKVLQTADSNMTIWVLVEEKDLKKAVNSLHREFKL